MVGKFNGLSIAPPSVQASRPPPPVQSVRPAASVDETNTEVASSVKLSGRSMMLSRLFRVTSPQAEPPVAREGTPEPEDVYPFLQQEDRSLLAKAYEFATEEGIDPSNVDAVAHDIAVHRRSSPSLDVLEPAEYLPPQPGDERKVALARAVTAYQLMPGSPESRARYADTTSRILQDHLSSGGAIDFEFVRRLLVQPNDCW